MSNTSDHLNNEITAGLARTKKMIYRQRMTNVAIISIIIAMMLSTLLCCGGIAVWWLMRASN